MGHNETKQALNEHANQKFVIPEDSEIEPMLLLDTTGSMNDPAALDSKISRHDLVHQAIQVIVSKLGEQDSQADKEEGGGGLRTVTFSGGFAYDLGDLSPDNLKEKWEKITWHGTTHIAVGWRKLKAVYEEEFGNAKKKPILMALIITDGEALDNDEFDKLLLHDHESFAVIAVLGYGEEHEKALKCYASVAKKNPRVKVIPYFDSETDPKVIANTLLKMIQN